MGVPLLDGLINTFGPFVVPVILFAVGLVGYLLLVVLSRAAGNNTDAE